MADALLGTTTSSDAAYEVQEDTADDSQGLTGPRPEAAGNDAPNWAHRCFYKYCNVKRAVYGSIFSGVVITALFIAVIALAVQVHQGTTSESEGSLPQEWKDYVTTKIDSTRDPCDSFYDYACGKWMQDFDIGSANTYTVAFSEDGAIVRRQLLTILQQHFPFVGTFYEGCVDTDAIDALPNPILAPMAEIEALTVNDFAALFRLMGSFNARGLASAAPLGTEVDTDFALGNPNRFYLEPSGLTFPSNYYYVNDTGFPLFNASVVYMLNATGMYNEVTATAQAYAIWQIEKGLNDIVPYELFQSFPDIIEQIAHMSPYAFQQNTSIPLDAYLQGRNATMAEVSVIGVTFFQNLMRVLESVPWTSVQAYMRWRLLYDGGVAALLPSPVRDAAEVLFSIGLTGVRSSVVDQSGLRPHPTARVRSSVLKGRQRLNDIGVTSSAETPTRSSGGGRVLPRDVDLALAELQRGSAARAQPTPDDPSTRELECLYVTKDMFEDLLSHEWIAEHFPESEKQFAMELVDMIYNKIGERIRAVTWLDDATREAAVKKWSYIVRNVGYSSDWEEFVSLNLAGVGYVFNDYIAVSQFNDRKYLAQVGQDRPRDEMSSHNYAMINAYYNPTANNINLPAGLMAPPMFLDTLPMSLNLAGYGMVIGHEITHGFDNSGRQFNGTGAFVDWWTPSSAENFEQRAQCLVDQYNAFPTPYGNIDGANTLGENIADHGGIAAAFNAYRAYSTANKNSNARMMKEFTNDQLFFLWYAQGWCSKYTPKGWQRVLRDVHSPAFARVNGPLSNLPAFAEAWSCPSSSYMGRSGTSSRCEIW